MAGPAVPWNVALKPSRLVFVLLAAACLSGCTPSSTAPADSPAHAPARPAVKVPPVAYSIPDTEVLDIRSALLGRDYQLFVALPESYAAHPQ